ncbi:hypothetical protein B0H13DRAFT_2484967 [Mycena leptocephala]|nr:hypothetical protein B0H13DRAFT_2484967 [Mycena leptocephala]
MRKHGSFFASLSLALIQRQPRRDVDAFVTYSYQLGLVFFCLSLLPTDLPLKIGAQVYRCTEIVAKGRDREGRIDADLKNAQYGGRIDSLLLAGLQNSRIFLPDRARMGRSAYRMYERDEHELREIEQVCKVRLESGCRDISPFGERNVKTEAEREVSGQRPEMSS